MDDMNKSLSPTSESVRAGLMIERNGEAYFTDAGLFAMAGSIAYAPDPDHEDGRRHCMSGVIRALGVARAGGLDEKAERVILWAFAEGIAPADGSEEGVALAKLCCWVSDLVGKGRMEHLIAGNLSH